MLREKPNWRTHKGESNEARHSGGTTRSNEEVLLWCSSSVTRGGRDAMLKASIILQELRKRKYAKGKAEPSWSFFGLSRNRRGFGGKRWSR